MNANLKRLMVIVLTVTVVFGFVTVRPQPVKAAVIATIVVDSITKDNSMWQQYWATDFHHRIVTIESAGVNVYRVTFVDSGYFVTNAAKSPGGNGVTLVEAGVNGNITGGITYLVTGILKSSLPTHVVADYRNDPPGSLKYLLPFFDSISGFSVLAWGWAYSTEVCGEWRDNDASETKWQTQRPNDLMGDIVGSPSVCQKPVVESQPQSCNANSEVLAKYVRHRVYVFLVQPGGLMPLQFEGKYSTFVEPGKLSDGVTPTGKVSLVFFPRGDSWLDFKGKTLLIIVAGYKDGWFWKPIQWPGKPDGTMFCDWATAWNANVGPSAK